MNKTIFILFVAAVLFSCKKAPVVPEPVKEHASLYYFTCDIDGVEYSIESNNAKYLEGFYIEPGNPADNWIDIYANLANVKPFGDLPALKSYNFNIHLGVLNGNAIGTHSTLQSTGSENDNQTKNYFQFYDTLYKQESYGASILPVFYLYPQNYSNMDIKITQIDSVMTGTFSGYMQSTWDVKPLRMKHVTNGRFRVVRM